MYFSSPSFLSNTRVISGSPDETLFQICERIFLSGRARPEHHIKNKKISYTNWD